MDFEDWKQLNNAALGVIDDFAAAGIRIPPGGPDSTLARLAQLQNRARAMDAGLDDELLYRVMRNGRIVHGPASLSRCRRYVGDQAAQHNPAWKIVKCQEYGQHFPVSIPRSSAEDVVLPVPVLRNPRASEPAITGRHSRAVDAQPQSDLEFYQRCAAECLRLA
jgi:hypothetical protein